MPVGNLLEHMGIDNLPVQEAFRVLRPGGRLMVSDIVFLRELPGSIRDSIEAYIGCVAGAMKKEEYLRAIEGAGFEDVKAIGESSNRRLKLFEYQRPSPDPLGETRHG